MSAGLFGSDNDWDEDDGTEADHDVLGHLSKSFAHGATKEDYAAVMANLALGMKAIQRREQDVVLLERADNALKSAQAVASEAIASDIALRLSELMADCEVTGAKLEIVSKEDGKLMLEPVTVLGVTEPLRRSVVTPDGVASNVAAIFQGKSQPNVVEIDGEKRFSLSVPLFMPQEKPRIACLTVVRHKAGFSDADVEAIEAQALELVPGILSLMRCMKKTAWPSAPHLHGWDRSVPAMDVCRELGDALRPENKNAEVRISHQLFRRDEAKERWFIDGTSFYDAQFAKGKGLPTASHTEDVGFIDAPVFADPEKTPRFAFPEAARLHGLRRMASASLFVKSGETVALQRRRYVSHTYLFGSSADDFLPSAALVNRVREFEQQALEGFDDHFNRCAVADFHAAMRRAPSLWRKKFRRVAELGCGRTLLGFMRTTFLRSLVRIFRANAASMFNLDRKQNLLKLVATTGVEFNDGNLLVDPSDRPVTVTYPVGNPQESGYGLMSYLADHPTCAPVRINSLDDYDHGAELGVPHDLPPVVWANMEPLDTDDRRFLGGVLRQGSEISVVRLVRSIELPPFTEGDVELLKDLFAAVERNDYSLTTAPEAPKARPLSAGPECIPGSLQAGC